jgi:Protein involved in initiation of plasmid replication
MDKQLVVKSNRLNEARYRLSVQEQRIILTMVSMIKPDDVDFKPYCFTVKEFMELVGITGKDTYSRIKQITASLRSRGFTIKEPDGDLQIGWISSAKYYDRQGQVELCFDPKLKPYLLALKKEFTRYQLKNTIKLKSAYSVRIYELLKQYQNIGHRIFDLDELKSILGIPEGSLEPYANFRMKVLDVARKELVTADISFDYTPIKTGRKVTDIRFDIKPNLDAIKRSKKQKTATAQVPVGQSHEEKERLQLQKEHHRLSDLVNDLKKNHPKKYEKLFNMAKKGISKQAIGRKTLIRFKMFEMVEDFIKREKITFK